MNIEEQYQALRPTEWYSIYELVREAGVDVRTWEESQRDKSAIEPGKNTYQNSRWTFGGGLEPLVACIWWDSLLRDTGNIERVSSSKADINRMESQRGRILGRDPKIQRRLSIKIGKSREFDSLISEAYRKQKPVRVILVDGERTESDELGVSTADWRLLDSESWYVHDYNAYEGNYRLIRGLEPPPIVHDPFDGADDPADAPDFQTLVAPGFLSETERQALIKARVGQGYFRDELIARWGGCSVTGCDEVGVLIASHIKPWSECSTRAERLSPDNGLLLTPNLDKLFDRKLITFEEAAPHNMIVTVSMNTVALGHLGVRNGTRLRRNDFEGMKPYLMYHREMFEELEMGRRAVRRRA